MERPGKRKDEFKILKWIWLAGAAISAALALRGASQLLHSGASVWIWQSYASGMRQVGDPGDAMLDAILGYLPFYLSVIMALFWTVESCVAFFVENLGPLGRFCANRALLQCGAAYVGIGGLILFLLYLDHQRSAAGGEVIPVPWLVLGGLASFAFLKDGTRAVFDSVRFRPPEEDSDGAVTYEWLYDSPPLAPDAPGEAKEPAGLRLVSAGRPDPPLLEGTGPACGRPIRIK